MRNPAWLWDFPFLGVVPLHPCLGTRLGTDAPMAVDRSGAESQENAGFARLLEAKTTRVPGVVSLRHRAGRR